MVKPSKQIIRPYGDRRDDGVVQLSFTLPVPLSEKAKEAAAVFTKKMGFSDVKVAAAERAADSYTFFVVYARSSVALDYSEIDVPEVVVKKMSFDDLNAFIKEKVKRRIVVFGACTGTDTHTVGIDAILNMKGYAGDYGLERYAWFEAFNLGSQVPNEDLIKKAMARNADAILVSQVVTQRDVHKDNSRHFIEAAKAAGIHGKVQLLLGGPRVDHKLALELGFDAGFGPGTKPSDVANYIVHALLKKEGKEPQDAHYQGEPQ
ncbi:L-beta-lysine 5,6-aminomutase beta subunit [Myxococcus hansupus]|uniref:L-beta-lysine 5,6-aminomutase beta subunit n=1 Tax=Pseudomyxococcus hansupus TaxID=1297742 RepID=A0A0H4WW96_9BACT|nr:MULTISPECIES: OAM dimerization domain-containing protein [Bacteria]AKQ65605.1 L-beta-lysine 5,6-aminomutase beta subunit [Myxococcus hansupus]MBL0696428.1 cobalamin-dependent protein [Comamonas sp. JC664]GHG84168.1 L-beta-lysine 5,6-aminomutase beta subunit [Comamonas sp. KCTC 72670]